MKATLTIDLDNEAFEYETGLELARILRELADKVKILTAPDLAYDFNRSITVMDVNGNSCGKFAITEGK